MTVMFFDPARPGVIRSDRVCRFEVGLNYSWLHVNSANYDYQRTANGGSGYLEYTLKSIIGTVGDFGGYANTRKGINDKALNYLFGPRFNWTMRNLHSMSNSFLAGRTRGVVHLGIPQLKTHSQPRPAAAWITG